MKVLINTIGKKIHTLVKENTPCLHKIRLECGFIQRPHFSLYYCVFFPTIMQILVGRLDSCFLTHIKKYMTINHASIFEKHVKMCVYIRHIKKCKFITLLGAYTQQKQVGWKVIFSEHGFAGSGRVSPSGSLRAAPSTFFAACSEALGGFNCVGKVPLKRQCKKYGIWEGKIKPHLGLGEVCIFLPTLFSKNHRNIML